MKENHGTPFDPSFCSQQFAQPAGATCGAQFQPLNGAPFRYQVTTLLPEQTFEGRGMAFFAQDEWRPMTNLTLKLGVRYDQAVYDYNEVITVKTFSRV